MKKKVGHCVSNENLNKPTNSAYFQFRDYMIAEPYFIDQPPGLL